MFIFVNIKNDVTVGASVELNIERYGKKAWTRRFACAKDMQ